MKSLHFNRSWLLTRHCVPDYERIKTKPFSLCLSVMTDTPERNTFSLNLKTQEVVDFLDSEKSKSGLTKTAYLNELLQALSGYPVIFSDPTGTMLDEMVAFRKLLNDDVMSKVPHLAAATRRDPVQMLLYLVEKGLEADEQLSSLIASDVRKSGDGKPLAAHPIELNGSLGSRSSAAA